MPSAHVFNWSEMGMICYKPYVLTTGPGRLIKKKCVQRCFWRQEVGHFHQEEVNWTDGVFSWNQLKSVDLSPPSTVYLALKASCLFRREFLSLVFVLVWEGCSYTVCNSLWVGVSGLFLGGGQGWGCVPGVIFRNKTSPKISQRWSSQIYLRPKPVFETVPQ